MNSISYILTTVLLFTSLFLVSQNSYAQFICGIEKLTFDDENEPAERNAINTEGTIIAFTSRQNLTGQNPDENNEIFIYDILDKDFTQLTDNLSPFNSFMPAPSADGNLIAYRQTDDNSDSQIFLLDRADGTTTQITDEPDGSNNPIINPLGTDIPFSSRADINGENPGGIVQLFNYNINAQVIDKLTNFTGFSAVGDITNSTNGNLISFTGRTDPGGQSQANIFDRNSNSITQLTSSDGEARAVRYGMDGSGNLISILSRGNPTGGGDTSGSLNIYLLDRTQDTFRQLTFDNTLSDLDPAINENGTCVTFTSQEDLTGENPANNWQVFIYDIVSETYTQVGRNLVGGVGSWNDPTPSSDCTKIAFNGRGNFNGPESTNEEQLYLASCFQNPRPIPTLSEWGLIATAAVLGFIAVVFMRRRKVAA